MRRDSQLHNKMLALLDDCASYCWQNRQISDQVSYSLEVYLNSLDVLLSNRDIEGDIVKE